MRRLKAQLMDMFSGKSQTPPDSINLSDSATYWSKTALGRTRPLVADGHIIGQRRPLAAPDPRSQTTSRSETARWSKTVYPSRKEVHNWNTPLRKSKPNVGARLLRRQPYTQIEIPASLPARLQVAKWEEEATLSLAQLGVLRCRVRSWAPST